jgi:putative hemolysin
LIDLLVILILVLVNGIFAMSELAVVSSRRVRLQQMAEHGNKGAKAALALAEHPNRFLSTVQVGITLIGIVAGTFGGATVAEHLAIYLNRVDIIAPHSETIAVVIVVALITYLSLILGELVPKRIAMQNPERIAALVAAPMNFLSRITAPAIWLLSFSTESVLRLLGLTAENEHFITKAEIISLIESGTGTGAFEKSEHEIVTRVFQLDEQRAIDVMTPRTEVTWLDIDMTREEIADSITQNKHSYYPVCRG